MAKKIMEAPASAKTDRGRLTGRMLVRIDGKADLKDILNGMKGIVLERLRVAVVEEESAGELRKRAAAKGSPFVIVEAERRIRKVEEGAGRGDGPGKSGRDGGAGKPGDGAGRGGGVFADSRVATWGIQAVNVAKSAYTGKGVKLAVLDTGFDFTHPDFAGRTIHRKSFVGRQAIDKDGHGTHCAGVAVGGNRASAKVSSAKDRGVAGPVKVGAGAAKGEKAKAGPRYGVASGARLFIGKILDDNGEGSDGTALEGIEWALEKGCRVISMSMGAEPEAAYSKLFEQVAQTVLAQGCLLIAATGNDSRRGKMAPVNHPANCPSILAVGALTAGMKVAEFSCGGAAASGRMSPFSKLDWNGQVDLVAPGDVIFSAKAGGGYGVESGTSMAVPFVSGMAALLWEEFPEAGAWEIWARLVQRARRLGLPASAVGAGLVYAG